MTIRKTPWPAGVPCWAELAAPDVPAAGAFYASVLGWEVGEPVSPSGYVMPGIGGAAAAGIAPAPEGQPAGWTLYLASDDAEATLAAVTGNGGTVVTALHDVGPLGRSFVATDPTGAAFGVWQAGSHLGAALTSAPGGLAWEDLRSPEPEAARAFYAAVFGYVSTPLPEAGGGYELFALPGHEAPLGGIGPFFGEPGLPHWLVYFGVSDIEAATAAARAGGGAVAQPLVESPYGRMAGILDPDGALFWVVEVAADNQGSGLPERTD